MKNLIPDPDPYNVLWDIQAFFNSMNVDPIPHKVNPDCILAEPEPVLTAPEP
jgi:hypothetical protein